MLEILRLPRRSAAVPLMESFDADRTTWVVSDLRSKFELQQSLLERDGGYLDTSVLRASDLWRLLLRRVQPDIQIVSRDFARSLIRSFLAEHGKDLGFGVSSERAVFAAMDRFAPLVFHPRGDELMEEWFDDNPASKERWGTSYFLARVALKKLYRDHRLLVAKWAPAVLQAEPGFEEHWDLPLVVDLGTELGTAEAQLFLRLSKKVDVKVLEPDPEWRGESAAVLRAYGDIEGAASKVSRLEDPGTGATRRRAARVSGQLAEVKTAVSTVRRWLDEGVALNEIAILAPEIEDYWPVLKAYLDEEGLPADKAVAVKLNSFPSVCRWLSRLRPRRGDLTSADLEMTFFSSGDAGRLRHEEFHALFANLYGEEDLKRHALVEKVLREGPRFADRMERDEFLLSAASLWDRRDPLNPLLQLAREVLQNASPGTSFSLGEWIRYVEAVAANREVGIEGGRPGGLLVTNFPSAKTSRLRRRVFLGLTEEGLRKAERNPLPLNDIARLSDLGFHLDHPDHGVLEFELRWLAESGAEEDLYLAGVSTFEGSIRAPSSLWLQMQDPAEAGGPPRMTVPDPTRLDGLQAAGPARWRRERGWEDARLEGLVRRLRQDLGDEAPGPIAAPLPERISPSFVRDYLNCPFEVAAGALFKLKDLEELDLDVARTGMGHLMHAIFQTITDEGWLERPAIGDGEIESLITGKRDELKLQLAEDGWWEPFLRRQVRVVKEFLRVEREWKNRHPKLTIHKSERTWELFFEPGTGTFSTEPAEGRLKITGRIDRVESDGADRFVVVDYKSSSFGLSDQADWLEENDLQLLFYMWALEKGAVPDHRGRVIGAFYYVHRDFTRTMGLQIEDEAGALFPPSARKKSKRSTDEAGKQELFKELENRIAQVVRDAGAGRWNPAPRDPKICQRCKWTGLCRAPHLN